MAEFLRLNLSTIIIAAVLIIIVVAIIIHLHNDTKKGKSMCGGSCEGCAMSGKCHTKSETDQK